MLTTLIRKELLTHILTLRLAVALAFTVLLSVMTAFMGSAEYSRNVAQYEEARRDAAQSLDNASTWRQLRPRIFLPPQPLSILGRGLSESAAQEYEIQFDNTDVNFEPITGVSTDLMRSLVRIDFVTVVALLLSFLAIVIGYDSICGERERGTLQLLMTNAVPRMQIVLGKLLGGLLALWAPLALSFTLALLILLSNPDVQFQPTDWLRLGLLFVLSCLFLGQIFVFSLAISACTRSSSTALILCLFFWLLAGVGWGNVLPSLSRYGVDEPPVQAFIEQNDALWDEFREIEREWIDKHPYPDDIFWAGYDRDGVMRYRHPAVYEWFTRYFDYMTPRRRELADRRYRYWHANQIPLARESLLVDAWGIISPLVNYQVLSYQLARSTMADKLHDGEAAHRYRRAYFDWLRDRGLFRDRRWFTDDPIDQEPMVPDPESLTDQQKQDNSDYMQSRRAWMERQQEAAARDDRRQLDTTEIPRFDATGARRSIVESLQAMRSGLLSMIVTSALFALLLMMRFTTYDPGR